MHAVIILKLELVLKMKRKYQQLMPLIKKKQDRKKMTRFSFK